MGKFIEEFYYGNIDPQARSTKQNKAVQKQMEVLMLNEDFLTERLSGENKKKFLDFVNAWSVISLGSKLCIRYLCSNRYPISRLAEGVSDMRDKKYYIALDDFERRVVVNCLNEMRNNLIANGKYTDAVDEILLKIIDAKQKKFKVIYKEA